MEQYINLVKRNEKLLNFLNREIPDEFDEWKIVITFYTALHFSNAYIVLLGKKQPKDHSERHHNLNPKNADSDYPVSEDSYNNYIDLYRASRKCRYNPFTNEKAHNTYLKTEYNYAIQNYEFLKNYFKKEGVTY